MSIDYELQLGGSGNGITSMLSALSGCPLRAEYEGSLARHNRELKGAAAIGTLAHAFMELHFEGELDGKDPREVNFFYEDGELAEIEGKTYSEALRMFNWFRTEFPDKDILGNIISTERQWPMCEEEREITKRLFGRGDLTARFDAVTDLKLEHVKLLQAMEIVDGIGLTPGQWLIDWKFYGRNESLRAPKALHSMQFAVYTAMMNEATPTGIRGMLQVAIIKTKEPKILITAVPCPDPGQLANIKYWMEHAAMEIARPSPNNCFSWMRMCPAMESGVCDGFGPEGGYDE